MSAPAGRPAWLDAPVVKEGAMEKKLKIQGYQQRYFVLRSKTLVYYKSHADAAGAPEKPLGVIPLKGALIEAPHGRSAARPAFRLSFKEANVRRGKSRWGQRDAGKAGPAAGGAGAKLVVKQAKYVLSASSLEEKSAWEEAVRAEVWRASTSDDDQAKKERRLSGMEKPESYKPMNIQAVIEEDEEEEELDEDDDD